MMNEDFKEKKLGINYRRDIAKSILAHCDYLDFIEVNTERFFLDHHDEDLHQIINNLPCVLHGLSLSLGDVDKIDDTYYEKLKKSLDKTNCSWFSEHIAATKVSGTEIRNLMPVPFTEESALNIIDKINKIAAITEKPFIVENVTYYYPMPGSTMTELDFINYILSYANCGLLLDLNNLFCNSENHVYDPIEFIDALPKEKVVEIHLAGGAKIYNMQVDTHASKVSDKVIELFQYCCKKIPFRGVVLERDSGPDNFQELLDEIMIIRKILQESMLEVAI